VEYDIDMSKSPESTEPKKKEDFLGVKGIEKIYRGGEEAIVKKDEEDLSKLPPPPTPPPPPPPEKKLFETPPRPGNPWAEEK
jgi:hypothetical protein